MRGRWSLMVKYLVGWLHLTAYSQPWRPSFCDSSSSPHLSLTLALRKLSCIIYEPTCVYKVHTCILDCQIPRITRPARVVLVWLLVIDLCQAATTVFHTVVIFLSIPTLLAPRLASQATYRSRQLIRQDHDNFNIELRISGKRLGCLWWKPNTLRASERTVRHVGLHHVIFLATNCVWTWLASLQRSRLLTAKQRLHYYFVPLTGMMYTLPMHIGM